jgi:hypothetical protein
MKLVQNLSLTNTKVPQNILLNLTIKLLQRSKSFPFLLLAKIKPHFYFWNQYSNFKILHLNMIVHS